MNKRKISRTFNLTLDPNLHEALVAYMFAHEFDNQGEATRSLLRQALASDPIDGYVSSQGARAFNEVRLSVMTRTAGFFREMAEQLETSIGLTSIGGGTKGIGNAG